jgi:hypothetical protein
MADVAADLRRCRQIADATARVSCYDAIALPAAPASAPAAAASATATPASIAAPPVAAPATAKPATTPTADPNFGLPVKVAPVGQDAVESTIVGRFDGWFPAARITLANEQVWEISDGSTAAYAARQSPKVRVTRGMLGSYFLEVEGISQTPRVKRVK